MDRSPTLAGCPGLAAHSIMQMRQVLVTTSLDTHQAIDVPSDLREALQATP